MVTHRLSWFNVHGSGLQSTDWVTSIRMMPKQEKHVRFTQWVKEANLNYNL
jgi:hypothetical protein